MSKAWIFSIPLIAIAILAEVAIVTYTWMYESSVVPVGVFTILGLSGVGATLVVVELLKLPLAFHIAGAGRVGKLVGLFGLALLCLVTWHAVKDMFTNEIIVSLEPSRQLVKQADELEARNVTLASSITGIEVDDEGSVKVRGEIQSQAASDIAMEEARRARAVELHRQQVQDIQSKSLLTQAEMAQRDRLVAERVQVREDAQADVDELNALIQQHEESAAKASQVQSERYGQELAAWQSQVQAMKTQHKNEQDAWKQACKDAESRHQSQLKSYRDLVSEYKAEIREIQENLDEEIKMHQQNDTLFYNAASKIKQAQERAEARMAPIHQQIEDLGGVPVLKLPVAPVALVLPPHPELMDHEGTVVEELRLEQAAIIAARDAQVAKIGTELDEMMEIANARAVAEGTNQRVAEQISDLDQKHRSELDEIDRAIQTIHSDRRLKLDELDAVAASAANRIEQSSRARAEIAKNEEVIAGLRLDAQEEIQATNVYRMATFLKYFMPNESEERRMEFFQSWVLPCICFFPAFLPAFFLELGASRFCPKPPPTPRRPRGHAYRRRSKTRFRGRMQKLAESRVQQACLMAEERAANAENEARQRIEDSTREHSEAMKAERERSQADLDAANKRIALAEAAREEDQVKFERRLHEVEANSAQQVMQIKSDSDRQVLEANAEIKISKAATQLANEKIEYNEKAAESRVNEILALAEHKVRAEIQAEVDELKRSESSLEKELEHKDAEVQSLRQQERESNQIIVGLREDNVNLAQRQMSITVVDDVEKKLAG